MAKKVSVFHETPRAEKPYAVLPIGYYYNHNLRNLHPGDIIEFFKGEATETRVLVRSCFIPINSAFFTFITRSIYGGWVTKDRIFRRWEVYAIVNGHRPDVFSREECVLIEVKDEENKP